MSVQMSVLHPSVRISFPDDCALILWRSGLGLLMAVFHLPAHPARISHKICRGRKVLKDVRPQDACIFRVLSPVSKKILLSVFYHGISLHLNCLL